MIQHPDRAPLVRLAATLPVGSAERRTILATIKKLAGTMDDTLARADLVSGALSKSKTEDRGPVFKVMQDGIGDFLTEFNNWATEKISEYGVSDLKGLRESDLSEDDEAELKVFDSRLKGYGAIAPKLLGLLGEIGESDKDAYEVLTNRRDYKLREAVKFGAAKGIHGMVQTMDDGRRQVTETGRGGISTPGSMGVDAEDLSQVLLAGGLFMPGMIFDMNMSDKTDIGGGVKIRGKFKDRKKPWAPAGTSIYTIAGAARGPLIKPGANYARTVAMNAAVDWKRSVHVELEYILTSADEGDMDTQAINMGAKLSLESLLGAELIDGVPVSNQLVLARFYLKKIKNQMDRMLKPGMAKATWQAVVEMIEDKQSPWKTGGGEDFAVNVPKVIKFLEDTREGQQIMEDNGLESVDKRVMQARWKDAVKSLKRQLSQLSDDELLSSLHLTLEGMVDDVPAHIKKIKEDQDLYKTYLSDMRKSASERKTSVKTITASERSAMIRLAATLPVGSPERRALIAGCEKLPNKAMQDNCEESKKDGVQPGKGKSKAKDDSKKDDGKMPADLLEKFEAKKAAKVYPKRNTPESRLVDHADDTPGGKAMRAVGQAIAEGKTPSAADVKKAIAHLEAKGDKNEWNPSLYKRDHKSMLHALKKFGGKKAAAPKTARPIGKGKNGYIAMYKRKQVEVMADTQLEARDLAAKHFRARKPYEVNVMLAEKGGKQVTHMPMFASKQELPEALKKNQFTSEDNPNPKGNDKDGDGKTNEPSPLKGKTAGAKLTSDQIAEVKGEMVKSGVPVRFMKGGGSLNIETGKTTPKGTNVMHQIVYWNFSKETAKKIADWLGARASFDKSASSDKKGALIRLAAALPVGSDERKTIIRLATGS